MHKIVASILGFAGICSCSDPAAMAARYVRAAVYVGGTVVLEGGTGDSGRVDADKVWNYLQEIRLKPTAQFDRIKAELVMKDGTAELKAEGRIQVEYGGRMEFKRITFEIHTDDKGMPYYIVSKGLIKDWFDKRYITRKDADTLKKRRPK